MSYRSLAGLTLAFGAISACRSDRPADDTAAAPAIEAAAPSIPSYTFTTTDYAFTGPAQISAGTVTLRMVNNGREPHHMVVVRLADGKTFEDLGAALKQPGPPPTWIRAVGGPNAVDPAKESNATLTLTPGQYATICFIPSLDGVPHLAKGMVGKLEVTPATGAAAAEPKADVEMTLSDYDFTLSTPLRTGTQTIRVANGGPQQHEIVLARLAPGKTIADLKTWLTSGMKDQPPAAFIGGVSPLENGEHNLFSATLEAGEYALLCFLPDAKDGKEHLMHGMAKQVTVS